MRSLVPWIAPLFLIGILAGCGGEDRLYGIPKDLPPGHTPPLPPPLPITAKDMRNQMRGIKPKPKKTAEPKAEVPPPDSPGQ